MLEIPTAISFDQAEALKERGRDYISSVDISSQDGPIELDVGAIEQANSLAVALLSAWHRTATLQDKSIVFVNLSEELRNIIALSGLDDVIKVSPANQ